jgi:hypothetical protein
VTGQHNQAEVRSLLMRPISGEASQIDMTETIFVLNGPNVGGDVGADGMPALQAIRDQLHEKAQTLGVALDLRQTITKARLSIGCRKPTR